MRERRAQKSGFTFIEVMIASVILMITVLGIANYRYNSTVNIMRGHAQNGATKVAVTLCNGWAGVDGTTAGALSFDPLSAYTDLFSRLDTASSGPLPPTDYTILNDTNYEIVLNGKSYFATMSYYDESDDTRTLNVAIAWDAQSVLTNTYATANKEYRLTMITER